MRVVCIFRDNEDYTRTVTDWLEDFYRRTGREIEKMDPDVDDSFCRVHEIMVFPTIAAIDNYGSVKMMWQGKEMPLIDDVNYYALQ